MLLKNIAYLDENLDVIFNRDIRIKDNYIKEIGENLEIEGEEEVINGENLLVTPGLCDAHTHIGQQLLKGKVLDAEGIIWKNIMLPFESSITDEIMSLNTKLALIEMIKAGTTSFVDAGSYHMDSACREIFKSGMRGAVTYSSMVDSSLPESICDTADEVIEKNNSLYKNWNEKGLIQVYYSIRSLMSANEELILKVSQEAKKRDAMLEAHMNEYDKEVENVIEKTGLPPYEYLEKLGVLNSDFIGAHSLILSEGEKEIIKKHDIKIVQCPFSNSGKALANTPQLIKNGIKIGLGSDGVAHGGLSLWDEMKTLRCMMNVTWGIQENNRSIMPAKTLLKMAMKNGKYFLRKNIGTIKEEYLADLIFIDLNQPHLWYSGNYTNTIFECVNKGDIIHSMVDGKWIMKDRKITTIDEGSVHEELKKWLSL
ncbi:MAG: amidohydrolase family protein [Fusobacterium sp.]|uniref:amidohydrolase family protein n=1 Tax=Fusobacterium sp. TaxID=68766 RepID=UPI00399ADFDD